MLLLKTLSGAVTIFSASWTKCFIWQLNSRNANLIRAFLKKFSILSSSILNLSLNSLLQVMFQSLKVQAIPCSVSSISQWCKAFRRTTYWQFRMHKWQLYSQLLNWKSNQSPRIFSSLFTGLLPLETVSIFTMCYNVLFSLDPLVLSTLNAKELAKVGEQYIQSDDNSLRDTAREVVKICKN